MRNLLQGLQELIEEVILVSREVWINPNAKWSAVVKYQPVGVPYKFLTRLPPMIVPLLPQMAQGEPMEQCPLSWLVSNFEKIYVNA